MSIKLNSIFFIFLLIFPGISFSAVSTSTCHCFRDRTYNPSDRFASDNYLLTTVFNSITAKHFQFSKKDIIKLKMESGVFNYDLFTGLYISQYTNLDAKQLFEEKKQGSWQNILAAKNIPAPFQENIVYTNIMKGDEAEKVSEIIIHEMFQELFDITEDKQDLLIKQGFTTKEIAFICTLAHHVQIPTESITTLYLEKGQSWSEIANHYGLSPTDAGKVAEQLPEIK